MNTIKTVMMLVCVGLMMFVMPAAAQNIVAIEDVTLPSGNTQDVPIRLLNSTGVGGAQVTLTFDQSIVNVTNAVEGDFTGIFNPDYSNVSDGILRITCMEFGDDLTGNLTIATITLDAVGTSGSCELGLYAELSTSGGGAPSSSVDNGTFTITPKNMNVTAVPSSVFVNTLTEVVFTVTSNGAPVPNAHVVIAGGGVNANGDTDANGEVPLNVNAANAGTIDVTATKAGYMDAPTTVTVNLNPMTVTAAPSTVTVNTSANVTFTVTSNGAPVQTANVALLGCGVNKNGNTAPDGTVTIEVNATGAGTIDVTATKAGYVDAPETVMASDQAGPVITQILFNSVANPTVTAGDDVNVSVRVTDSGGWANISEVLIDMSAFGAGSAEELTSRIANGTDWALFNKSIQVTKATAAKATANASGTGGNWSGDFESDTLTVNPAGAYQLKIFGPDSGAPAENTLYQQAAIQDQYGNNLTAANAPFSHVVTMSKTAGHALIKEPNPQTITEANTTPGGGFDTTFEVYDSKDEETTIKVTSPGLLPDTKTLTYYGSMDHLDVSLNKTSINANGGKDTILVTVQLKDADGDDIQSAGESVQISQNTGAGLFAGLVASTTDANGKATFVITSTPKSGSDEIYAIATPSGATGTSDTITVTAIVNPANSAMTPADTTVMAGTEVSVSVTTRDYDNKIISGATVAFNVTNGKGKLDGTAAGTPVTAVSDAAGLAKVTFVCNTAGDASTIDATIGGVVVGSGNRPIITTTPNVISQFAVNPGKGIGLKNEPGTLQQIAIQMKDVYGNNNSTADVQILVTTDNTVLGNMTNGTTYYNNDLHLTTDASGIATFTYQVNASEAGTANLAISATAYGVTDNIAIVTSGPEGIHLSFNESIPMVGESVRATAQLTNEAGDPLAIGGKNITITVRNPNGTLVGTGEIPTEGNGAATFVITPAMVNGMPGAYTVTAKSDLYGLEDVNTTTFVGPAVKLVLEANQTALLVNQTVSLTATMKDANDLTTSSLDGGEVIFNANGVQIASVVLDNGVASTTYTRSTSAIVMIEAFHTVTLQDSVSVVFGDVGLLNMTVIATPDTITVSEATDITVNVTDESTGTPIDGATVTLSAGPWSESKTTIGGECVFNVTSPSTGTINVNVTASGYNDGSTTVTVVEVGLTGDINGDGTVNYIDLGMLGASYGLSVGETGYNASADLNGDGTVNYIDLGMLGAHYGESI